MVFLNVLKTRAALSWLTSSIRDIISMNGVAFPLYNMFITRQNLAQVAQEL